MDEWSGDGGCGVQYFSQVGANRVATGAGMEFPAGLGLPEKLVVLQEKMKAGDPLARKVYETIGAYLGYAIAHYADFYELKHILVLGRVTTGEGGDILVERAQRRFCARSSRTLAEQVHHRAAGRKEPPRGPIHRRRQPAGQIVKEKA